MPPFPSDEAIAEIEKSFGRPLGEIYARFERKQVASASVAQVDFATSFAGREVAVKVLRPGIAPVIAHDIALLDSFDGLFKRSCARPMPARNSLLR